MSGLPSTFMSKKSADGSPGISFISRIVPVASNKNIYAGDTFQFRIGGLQRNHYLDTSNSFLRFKVTNNSTTKFRLGKCGVGSLFRSIQLQQAGSTLSNFQQYGVHRTMEFFKEASTDAVTGTLNSLIGTEEVNQGREILVKGSTFYHKNVFCDPICKHASLFDGHTSKYVPLFSRDSLDLIYELGDYQYGGFWEANDAAGLASVNNQSLELSDVELVLSIVQLSPEVVAQHSKIHNGLFIFETSSYGLNQFSLSDFTNQSLNLGLGYTSLEEISFVQIPKTDGSGSKIFVKASNDLNSTFVHSGLEKYSFVVDGSLVEATRAVKSGIAEVVAMALISKGMLNKAESFSKLYYSELQQDVESIFAGATDSEYFACRNTVGAYVATLDLCVYKNNKQNVLCSGRNVLSASTQLNLEFGTSAGVHHKVDLLAFSKYRQILSLDINSTGIWQVLQ
jgi:hypothetical protein